ncbi:hypothetical protein AL538_28090 [Vibrio harveyi]|uniref:Uncharacterized protein n=1 Tax=Vibrio harveyi TaxID=669 RepID=A0ABM6RM27_VIBHA|nr:hypothetical protein AL538_28090 [Vibrio harveyi]
MSFLEYDSLFLENEPAKVSDNLQFLPTPYLNYCYSEKHHTTTWFDRTTFVFRYSLTFQLELSGS